MTSLGKRPGRQLLEATRIRARAAVSPADSITMLDREHADRLEAAAFASVEAEIGMGGELVPTENNFHHHDLVNTVADPNYVTARASQERLELAEGANVLEAALDAVATIDPQDNFQKMLGHQMTVLHRSIMRMARHFDAQVDRLEGKIEGEAAQRLNVETCRTAGALARMASAYQDGHLALHRIRSGASQVVVVQHVQVRDGGQAVVAGKIGGAQPKRRGRRKNRGRTS